MTLAALSLVACTGGSPLAGDGGTSTAPSDGGAPSTLTGDGGTAPTGGDTGDTGSVPGGTGDGGAGDDGAAVLDLRLRGPYAVRASSDGYYSSQGCALSYTRFQPDGPSEPPFVVLAHGLQRSGEQMEVWAEHLASWGLDAVAPSLCNSHVWDLDQEENGADLVELAGALRPGPVSYVGHSAGGLAALVAAARDPSARTWLGLDPTEWDGIGASVEDGLSVPLGLLVGDPGLCNLDNNMLDLLADRPSLLALRVTEADHCDFENPTDAVCTLACGTSGNDRFSEEEIAATIIGLTTAWLLGQSGGDGLHWWEEGGIGRSLLEADGAVSAP